MGELTTTTVLNPEQHLLLDQTLLRLPYELNRKNFKTSQRLIERERDTVLASLKSTANAAFSSTNRSFPDPGTPSLPTSPTTTAETALTSLDALIARMQGLKRKLASLHDEELALHSASRRRLAHLQDLYEIPSLADVKYEEWSKVRLSRLLVDYLLRGGYEESARALAREKGIEELVDVDAFVQCHRVEDSLKKGRTQECLVWCAENKQALKKINSNLEFELRLQQYIELVRSCDTTKLMEATVHARKHLSPHQDTNFGIRAAGLLAFAPETCAEPYRTLYSQERWDHLANLFVQTHHELFALPSRPLLHMALSAGLTALKTPSCHSCFASVSTNTSSSSSSVCPICSTELNELARNVPYAQHTKSYVENDPVVLPNGRIYGRERLMQVNEKLGTPPGKIRDPMDRSQVFDEATIKKVFIM